MNRGSKIITMKTTPIIKQNTYDYSLDYSIFFWLCLHLIAVGFVKKMQKTAGRLNKRVVDFWSDSGLRNNAGHDSN